MIRQGRIKWLIIEISQNDDVLLGLFKLSFFNRVSQTDTQKNPDWDDLRKYESG